MTLSSDESILTPFDIPTPSGAEGWELMYPYYYVCSEERRDYEKHASYFWTEMVWPEIMLPFDTIVIETAGRGMSVYQGKVLSLPGVRGMNWRFIRGYGINVNLPPITDPKVNEQRRANFEKKLNYVVSNWENLYAKWKKDVEALIEDIRAIEIPAQLPDEEDPSILFEAKGITSGTDLLLKFDRVIDNLLTIWDGYQFNYLGAGYAAYMALMFFLKERFHEITDLEIGKMISGTELIVFRPTEELQKLSRLALQLGVSDVITKAKDPDEMYSQLKRTTSGSTWLSEFEKSKYPWFYQLIVQGSFPYSRNKSWIEDLSIPLGFIKTYVKMLQKGEPIDRPIKELKEERERSADKWYKLLKTDKDKTTFLYLLNASRKLYPAVEEQNFYVKHWHYSIFREKIRQFAGILVKYGVIKQIEDVFYLHYTEIRQALSEAVLNWASDMTQGARNYWIPRIEKRKDIIKILERNRPPKRFGPVPKVAEPFVVIHSGMTPENVQLMMKPPSDDVSEIPGYAASPGIAEGIARVMTSVEQCDQILPGEIAVVLSTSPSWIPIFSRIKALVMDEGGVMSHGAIIAREVGVPAVTGTFIATKAIKTGQRIRVDGSAGIVTVLKK